VPGALVFDFDGVIVNSEPVHLRALQAVLVGEGVRLSAREYYAHYVGLSDREAFEALARDAGRSWTPAHVEALVADKSAEVQRVLAADSPLFPEAAERIRALSAEWPLAVASGALRHEIEQVLGRADLTSCFVTIVAAGDTPRSKPAPDPYRLAVLRLSAQLGTTLAAASVAAVEDTLQGLASARAAGLRTIAVSTTYPARVLGEADYVTTDISAITPDFVRRIFAA
jgi:HAD superfamily hydrolase (TIGR01509 family)